MALLQFEGTAIRFKAAPNYRPADLVVLNRQRAFRRVGIAPDHLTPECPRDVENFLGRRQANRSRDVLTGEGLSERSNGISG